MLKKLKIKNVGPAPELELDFGERLNILTGDNGVGKSFILDIAWWALTRRWPAEINRKIPSGMMARPVDMKKGMIEFEFTVNKETEAYKSEFDRSSQAWVGKAGRPSNPGLILYAQVDGSFAVWDPARNYWHREGNVDVQDRPPAYVFSPKEIWDGLKDNEWGFLSNGLISDWAGWQKEKSSAYKNLVSVLKTLSSSSDEPILPGGFSRVSLDDSRDIPTLRMSYGQDVPVIHASAGMRRIISLAYLLVWAWEEHLQACKLLGQEPSKQLIFLIDEVEAHLHPKWQRKIVRALLDVMKKLAKNADVQIIMATHSPLVLASVEPVFTPSKDAWFDLDIQGEKGANVVLTKRPFVRKGDASSWLLSDAFDMSSSRSIEAEQAINEASELMMDENPSIEGIKKVDKKLRAVLGELDDFWMRWRYIAQKKGWDL